jgi:two-component system copper resistance phosphate regulon response regulator CusR
MRILVIEGEPVVAMMVVNALTQAGCEVQAALNAEKGMKLAQTSEFDLIVLDMNMPGSFEICSSLKENPFFQTPIVLVSGQLRAEDIRQGLDLGAVDYVKKPFNVLDFVSRILLHVNPTTVHV